MTRHAHEFQCTECNFFNYPMLRDNMSGNYTIKCGGHHRDHRSKQWPDDPASICGHEHYRVIKDGVVTEDRHNKNLPAAEVIHVMPSACSATKRQLGAVAELRQKEAAGLHTAPSAPSGGGTAAKMLAAIRRIGRDEA